MKCDCSYKCYINAEFSLKTPNLATKINPKSEKKEKKKYLGVFMRLHCTPRVQIMQFLQMHLLALLAQIKKSITEKNFSKAHLLKRSGKYAFLGMNGNVLLPVLVKIAIIVGIRLVVVYTEFLSCP